MNAGTVERIVLGSVLGGIVFCLVVHLIERVFGRQDWLHP